MSESWLQMVRDPNPWTAPQPLPAPIETDRLVVRLYQRGDGPRLFRAIEADREALLPWMVWARTDHQEEADSIFYAERSRRKVAKLDCTDFPMVISERDSGEQLGGTGLHGVDSGLHTAEIGYWIRGDRHGQGLCTEAVGALISAALRPASEGGWGLRRIIIFNAVGNVASRCVCEKLGLRLEQRAKQDRYLGPEGVGGAPGYCDTLGFAVLRDEWDFERNRGPG